MGASVNVGVQRAGQRIQEQAWRAPRSCNASTRRRPTTLSVSSSGAAARPPANRGSTHPRHHPHQGIRCRAGKRARLFTAKMPVPESGRASRRDEQQPPRLSCRRIYLIWRRPTTPPFSIGIQGCQTRQHGPTYCSLVWRIDEWSFTADKIANTPARMIEGLRSAQLGGVPPRFGNWHFPPVRPARPPSSPARQKIGPQLSWRVAVLVGSGCLPPSWLSPAARAPTRPTILRTCPQ